MTRSVDPRAVEARTQAIGQELFAAARREHAHLSTLNRWTSEVLSWCLAEPSLKGQVLRFIDVLPSLHTPQDIARHLREYFPSADSRLPRALRLGSQLARPGLLTQRALAGVIHRLVEQVARQFIAASSPEAAAGAIHALAARGASCSLDVLGEQVLSDVEADRYVEQCRVLLQESAAAYETLPASTSLLSCGPRVNLSVKPSALTSRFDPISPAQSLDRATARLHPLLQRADQHGALVNLDMEQYALRDLTLALAQQLLLERTPGSGAHLGIVVQAYLRDVEATVEHLLTWLAAHERTLAIRLVKGAYWDAEVAQAIQRGWPVPVHQEKAATDLAFERLTQRLLSAHPLVTTAIASHNVRSIAHAMAVAETLGLAKDQVEFQLLYGMGEAIHAAIVSMGYPVRIYTPIGQLIPGMAYLVRRILENTSNESFLRQEFLRERSAEELLRPPVVLPARPEDSHAAAASERWQSEPFVDFSKDANRRRMQEALSGVKSQLGHEYPLWLGSGAVRSRETLTVCNPAHPAEVIGRVTRGTYEHVLQAVREASDAQPHWASRPATERIALLRNAAALLRDRRLELAAWEVHEVGKSWREADVDVLEAIEYLEYYSDQMEELGRGRSLAQRPGERNEYRYVPRGVAVVIAPWNFPSAILTGMASAALVAGNTVVLKPAEQSSVTAAHITRLLHEAGIPPAVLQSVPGVGEEIGPGLVRHPKVQTILFTGSKAVGLSIFEACGKLPPGQRFIKRVIAEMGGKNAIIIDADADVDAAIAGTMQSAFGYAGQKCSAASRVIVHAAVYERVLARLAASMDSLVVGDPADPGTDVGPLIEESAKQRLLEAIAHANDVATIAYQYPSTRLPSTGYFVPPTLVTNVPLEDRLVKQELFGPLLCLMRADTFEEALAIANDTDYALTGGVYSRSPSHLEQSVDAFDVGNLYLNRPITGAMVGRQPFGGHRLSGLGTKAGGPDYLLQLVLPKTICANTARYGTPLD